MFWSSGTTVRRAGVRRYRIVLVALLLATLAATAVFAAPTATANHNGGEKCVSGEICFSKHNPFDSRRYQKHFHGSKDHTGYYWWDKRLNRRAGAIKNDASGIRNRTGCSVKLIDDNFASPDGIRWYAPRGEWIDFDNGMNDDNDRHEKHC